MDETSTVREQEDSRRGWRVRPAFLADWEKKHSKEPDKPEGSPEKKTVAEQSAEPKPSNLAPPPPPADAKKTFLVTYRLPGLKGKPVHTDEIHAASADDGRNECQKSHPRAVHMEISVSKKSRNLPNRPRANRQVGLETAERGGAPGASSSWRRPT